MHQRFGLCSCFCVTQYFNGATVAVTANSGFGAAAKRDGAQAASPVKTSCLADRRIRQAAALPIRPWGFALLRVCFARIKSASLFLFFLFFFPKGRLRRVPPLKSRCLVEKIKKKQPCNNGLCKSLCSGSQLVGRNAKMG